MHPINRSISFYVGSVVCMLRVLCVDVDEEKLPASNWTEIKMLHRCGRREYAEQLHFNGNRNIIPGVTVTR